MAERREAEGADTSPESSNELDELVFELLERREVDGDGAIDALCREHPEHASALRARIAALCDAGLIEAPASDESFPEQLGEFRLLERLGGGGMGVVYLAEQTSLGRRVALKLIRPEQMYFPGSRGRFRREVEAVARLAHPNIVPVYTVGEERGIPYFAMEHVRGASLSDVVRDLRARSPGDLAGSDFSAAVARIAGGEAEDARTTRLFAGTWKDVCLRIVRLVADALEHAHRRGVLHRDVKPSNVMVTREGRVLLLDFGLASLQGTGRLTRTGSQLGSLHYMSPEQVQGGAATIGPSADIYGLGVTLYELLALHVPFAAASDELTKRKIVEGRPIALRARNPALSADVEVVCATAMDLEPARRYASAEAFARDLSNVLEHRPIEARPAGAMIRTRRWVERHPGWAAAGALSFIALTIGPLAFALQARDARVRIEKQRDAAEANRVRAENNFQSALEAVDLITRVGGDRLEGIPQVEDVRRELLEKALRFYQGLLDQKGDDASLAFELARAELRVSELDFELGRIADSQRAAEGALARLQSLSAESVASPSRPFALDEERSRAHAQLGDVLRRQHELSAAATELRAAESLLARMLPDARSTAAHRFHLVLVREELAEVQRAEHDLAGAETTLRETHAMLAELARAEPGELAYASRLGRNMQLSGDVLHDMKRYADARAQHDDARRQFDDLLARHPGDVSLRELLAVSHSQIALDLQAERDLAPALEQYESALRILRDLAADFPRIPRYRVDICTYIDNMAAICVATEQPERVLPLYEEGIRGLERAVEGAPDVPSLRRRLLLAQANLCALLVQTGREDEAYARSQATIPSLRAELERAPGDVEVRAGLRVMSLNLADVLVARGDCAEAARVLDAAPPLATTDECMRSAALHALCCARLQDGKARVLALLDRAIESGFDDAESLANDRDFAALRTDPEFQARVERIRERARTRAK